MDAAILRLHHERERRCHFRRGEGAGDIVRRYLHGTPFEVHFVTAREDVTYDRSRRVAECDDPGDKSVATLSAQLSQSVRKQIRRLEELALPR